jgi:hypothetical protein
MTALRGLGANAIDAVCRMTGHMQWAPWGWWWYEYVCCTWGALVEEEDS